MTGSVEICAEDLSAWITQTLGLLVDDATAIEVDTQAGRSVVMFEIHVGPEDLCRVLGKGGATIDAIRLILQKTSGRTGKRYLVYVDSNPAEA